MFPIARLPHAVTGLTACLLIAGCQFGQAPTVPASGSNPTATPSALPIPVQPSAVTPTAGAELPRLAAVVTFPAGTMPLLKSSLRTQADVDPRDLALSDLGRLQIVLAGRPLRPDQVQFSQLQWDSSGQIRFVLTLADVSQAPGQLLRLTLPGPNVTLTGTTTAGSAGLDVNVRTTARAMLREALANRGKPELEPGDDAIDLLAARLANALLTATGTSDPFATSEISRILATLADAISRGLPASQQAGTINAGGGHNAPPAVPTITAVTPDNGLVGTSPVLTISGANLTAGTTVTIGGKPATVITTEGASLTATVPAGLATGAQAIRVTLPNGQFAVLAAGYTVTVHTVSGHTPAWAPVGTSPTLTITGTRFADGATVTVGGQPATGVTVVSPTQITATVPASLPVGTHDLVVTNPGGATVTAPDPLTLAAPAISGITPPWAAAGVATTLTITGTYFSDGATVTIGGQPATGLTVVSPTQITATAPASLDPGAQPVVVTNPGGATATVPWTVAAPTIVSISPSDGPRYQPNVITITGTSFAAGATVTIDGKPAADVRTDSDTRITATVPAGLSPGTKTVTVTNPGGRSANLIGGFTATGPAVGVTVGVQDGQPYSGPTWGRDGH